MRPGNASEHEDGYSSSENPEQGTLIVDVDPKKEPPKFVRFTIKSLQLLCAVNVVTLLAWLSYLTIFILIDASVRANGLQILIEVILATIMAQIIGYWYVRSQQWQNMWLYGLLCGILFCANFYVFLTERKIIPAKVHIFRVKSIYPELAYLMISLELSFLMAMFLYFEMRKYAPTKKTLKKKVAEKVNKNGNEQTI